MYTFDLLFSTGQAKVLWVESEFFDSSIPTRAGQRQKGWTRGLLFTNSIYSNTGTRSFDHIATESYSVNTAYTHQTSTS